MTNFALCCNKKKQNNGVDFTMEYILENIKQILLFLLQFCVYKRDAY